MSVLRPLFVSLLSLRRLRSKLFELIGPDLRSALRDPRAKAPGPDVGLDLRYAGLSGARPLLVPRFRSGRAPANTGYSRLNKHSRSKSPQPPLLPDLQAADAIFFLHD